MKLPNETILLVLESWQLQASQGGNINNIYVDIINCIKSQESKLSLAYKENELLKTWVKHHQKTVEIKLEEVARLKAQIEELKKGLR